MHDQVVYLDLNLAFSHGRLSRQGHENKEKKPHTRHDPSHELKRANHNAANVFDTGQQVEQGET